MTTTTPTAYLPVNCSRFQPGSSDNPLDLPALCLVDADQADKFSNRRLYTTSTGLVTWTQMVRDGDQRLEFNQSIAEQVLGLVDVLHGRIQHLNGDRLDCRRANLSVSAKGDRRVKAVRPGTSFHQTDEFKVALAHRLAGAELTRLAGRTAGIRAGAPVRYTDERVRAILNYLINPKNGFHDVPVYALPKQIPLEVCDPRISVPTLRLLIDGKLHRQPDHLVDYTKLAEFFPSRFAKRAKKRALMILADQAALEKRSRDLTGYLDRHNLTFRGTLVVNGTHTAAAAPSPAEQTAATP